MDRHNFYIAQQTTCLKPLAKFLYGGENQGFSNAFVELNKPLADNDEVIGIGQTLYLPSINDNHEQNKSVIQSALKAIDEDTQKLSIKQKILKAYNHVPLALAATSQYLGATAGLIEYRYSRIEDIMQSINNI